MTIPACEPVKLTAWTPWSMIAMQSSGHRDPLPGGEEHVELPAVRVLGHVVGEADEVVGGLAHRRDDHDHLIALAMGPDDVLGDGPDAVGIRDRGPAVLLDDHWHGTKARRGRSRGPGGY